MSENRPTNGAPAAAEVGTDPTVLALGRRLERAVRKIGDLEVNLRQLAADVHALARRMAPPDEPDDRTGDEPPAVRSWLLAESPAQAIADLADLVEWLDAVYLRYARMPLSPCWLWHPDIVEELWWLRCAHADAYHVESGSVLRVGDWHDRQRPGVERRVNAVLGKCGLSRHAPRNGRPPDVPAEPARAPMTDHGGAVAAAWTTAPPSDRAVPAPTAAQLAEADACQRASYRSH